MNRLAILGAALVVGGVAVVDVILGQQLTLPLPVMEQRDASMPWYLTWAMVWLNVACAVALGVFLLSSLVRNPNRR